MTCRDRSTIELNVRLTFQRQKRLSCKNGDKWEIFAGLLTNQYAYGKFEREFIIESDRRKLVMAKAEMGAADRLAAAVKSRRAACDLAGCAQYWR